MVPLKEKGKRNIQRLIEVNGDLTELIYPQRGLRRGDPFPPYLFLICAKGFSSLLHIAEEQGLIEGIQICPGAPSVFTLAFCG